MTTKLNERKEAELLSSYIDDLNAGTVSSTHDLLQKYDQMGVSLKQDLELLLLLKGGDLFNPAPFERKEAAFSRLCSALEKQASEHISITNRTDILILLFELMGQIWGNIKLEKLVFLLEKEGKCASFVPDFYAHKAYSYGPFDKEILKDVNTLFDLGIIDKKTIVPPSSKSEHDLEIPMEKRVDTIYELTPQGKKIGQGLKNTAKAEKPDLLKAIQQIIDKHGKKNAEALIAYTYRHYPEMASKSKIREKYLSSNNE